MPSARRNVDFPDMLDPVMSVPRACSEIELGTGAGRRGWKTSSTSSADAAVGELGSAGVGQAFAERRGGLRGVELAHGQEGRAQRGMADGAEGPRERARFEQEEDVDVLVEEVGRAARGEQGDRAGNGTGGPVMLGQDAGVLLEAGQAAARQRAGGGEEGGEVSQAEDLGTVPDPRAGMEDVVHPEERRRAAASPPVRATTERARRGRLAPPSRSASPAAGLQDPRDPRAARRPRRRACCGRGGRASSCTASRARASSWKRRIVRSRLSKVG